MLSGNINNFCNLSKFTNIQDFNNNIEQWMLDIKDRFTKAELVALKRLVRFSAKITGVCNAKIGTIVSATHEKDGAGISRSTFKRMVTKAKNLGIITVYATVRKNGSKSSNVYAFNRFCSQSEPSKSAKLNPPQTSNLCKTSNIKDVNKRNRDFPTRQNTKLNNTLDASYTSERVPKKFTNYVKSFFNDAKQIEEFWKLVTISASKNKIVDEVIEEAIIAFKTLIRKIKFSSVQNKYGFFYGVLNKKFKAKYRVDLFNEVWASSY
ncbi:hypothetical protein [Oceanobacillus picturae]|uniref:hypothetical protein n=1 Tax=Oceanobacillus picturae TaxID=171693 RepID=UPI00217561E2|nr:hypothetical protein [Oceanobacillus picturae]